MRLPIGIFYLGMDALAGMLAGAHAMGLAFRERANKCGN
jgi:hypothetical protein